MTTAIALAADYTNLLQLLESSDELTPEMITDTLEGIEGELADKLDAIMVIARNNLGHAKTCDEEIKRLAERKKSFENKDKTLRKYILSCLLAANLDKLKTPKNSFTARKGSVSVVIDNESGIIKRWAPPNENNTQAYINSVAQATGVTPDQRIDTNDSRFMIKLLQAIIKHENGNQPYSSDTFDRAVEQAG